MHCKSLWIKASAKCINVNIYIYIYIEREREREKEPNRYWKSSLAKTVFLNFTNHVFSLCIPINLNQTAIGLFLLGKIMKEYKQTQYKYDNTIKNMIFEDF